MKGSLKEMTASFTHFMVEIIANHHLKIKEKIGEYVTDLQKKVCLNDILLEKIGQEPKSFPIIFDVTVKNEVYQFRIEKSFYSNWYDGYIQKSVHNADELYLLSQWQYGLFNNNEFSLVYQPILNTETNTCINVEALLRWQHKGTLISPEEFIPILERNNQISRLEYWVIKNVAYQMYEWKKQGIQVKVHINISVQTLQEKKFHNCLMNILQTHGISPCSIIFEITEHKQLEITDVLLKNMNSLAQKGIDFAIDDFGAGNTSFSYLSKIPVSIVKTDKQFLIDEKNEMLFTAIIKSLQTLNVTIMAEGLENKEMMNIILENDIQFVQGFGYSVPLKKEDLIIFLKSQSITSANLAVIERNANNLRVKRSEFATQQ